MLAKQLGIQLTAHLKSLSLNQKSEEASMRDDSYASIGVGETLEALPDSLGTQSSTLGIMRRVVPFFGTCGEIDLGKLGR